MKWGRKQVKQQQEEKMNSSSSFSISKVFSKLWNLSSKPKPTPTKPKRSTGPVSFPPPPPSPRQTSDSDHLSFSPAVLDHLIARFPASFHDAGNAPRRRSIGEDDSLLARDRTSHRRGIARSARHNSVGQLEFRPPPSFSDPRSEFHFAESQPLGHLIPFSRRSSRRWSRNLEPASESEKSESDPARVRRRRRRRGRRRRRKVRREGDGAWDETERKPPLPSDPDRTAQNRVGGEARKSFSGRIRPKVKVCSPRLSVASRAEMERIKAASERRRAEEKTGLESFAVVKRSCDPQKDFRESMVEMIWEKGLGRPEELERLLACYLWLNSDEHHDVIVKVFRQVWFDLNPERFSCRRFVG